MKKNKILCIFNQTHKTRKPWIDHHVDVDYAKENEKTQKLILCSRLQAESNDENVGPN